MSLIRSWGDLVTLNFGVQRCELKTQQLGGTRLTTRRSTQRIANMLNYNLPNLFIKFCALLQVHRHTIGKRLYLLQKL